MSNIIQLLEKLGQDANLQTPEAFEQAIATSNLSDELKAALVQQSPQNILILAAPDEVDAENSAKALLEQELEIPQVECVAIFPAEDDDGTESDDPDDSEESAILKVA